MFESRLKQVATNLSLAALSFSLLSGCSDYGAFPPPGSEGTNAPLVQTGVCFAFPELGARVRLEKKGFDHIVSDVVVSRPGTYTFSFHYTVQSGRSSFRTVTLPTQITFSTPKEFPAAGEEYHLPKDKLPKDDFHSAARARLEYNNGTYYNYRDIEYGSMNLEYAPREQLPKHSSVSNGTMVRLQDASLPPPPENQR